MFISIRQRLICFTAKLHHILEWVLWSLIHIPEAFRIFANPVLKDLRRHPLPANRYSQSLNPATYDAYNQCLWSEHEAISDLQLMNARCLGYLIIHAPDDNARSYVSHEILNCLGNKNKINELAWFYIHYLFRFFHKKSEYPSSGQPTPIDHKPGKHAALVRDNFRCMVTGSVDTNYYRSMRSNDELIANNLTGVRLESTKFSHIFPPSIDLKAKELSDSKVHYMETIRGIVYNYGHIDIHELSTDGHKLSNGLTLSLQVDAAFDELFLWFEAIPKTEHTYRVFTLPYYVVADWLPWFRLVTFKTTTDHQLPDPRYLRLHASLCKVALLSGVFGYLSVYDFVLADSDDGSSAE